MSVGDRTDPLLSCRFVVEIEGIIVAGFSEVSGLEVEVSTEEYVEGGVNHLTHRLPKGARFSNVVLTRGVTTSDALWAWQRELVQGRVARKTVRLILLDALGEEKMAWRCLAAWPVAWRGPDFRADASVVAIESLELAHSGIDRM